MNLAFQALVILIFLTPGFTFRYVYNAGAWAYPLGRLGPISEQVPKALFHATWINFAAASLATTAHQLFPQLISPINYRAAIYWLANSFGKDQNKFDVAVTSIADYPRDLFAYFVLLHALSWGFGFGFHSIVRNYKWDRKRKWFRFDNDWHYLFTGEVLDFPDPSYTTTSMGEPRVIASHQDRKATVIAAIVDVKGSSYLYQGFIIDFFFDLDGSLDRILLDGVKRRDLIKDRSSPPDVPSYFDNDGLYVVRGHYFVLRMSEITTLNIDYITKADLDILAELEAKQPAESERNPTNSIEKGFW